MPLDRIKNGKGESFNLKTEKGGGSKGKGKAVHLGKVQRNTDILPTDLFKEIKKNLVLSKKKMGEMCKTLRNSRSKLLLILGKNYMILIIF